MNAIMKGSFDAPDKTESPGQKLTVETVTVGDLTMKKVAADPGWKWSEHLKSVVKTESCQTHHLIYMISGTLASRMNDGTTLEFNPGEVGSIPPGHDGWTVGDKPAVWLEMPHSS